MDWRTLFDAQARVLQPGAQETIIEALGDIREALQSRDRSPEVTVEVSLPIPLAMLLGHELRFVLGGPAVGRGAQLGTDRDGKHLTWVVHARSIEVLPIDRDPATDPLDADDIRSLAAHIAKRLNRLHGDGAPKQLLLRGPAAVGAAVGLAANASGPTYVPFFDAHDYYSGGV